MAKLSQIADDIARMAGQPRDDTHDHLLAYVAERLSILSYDGVEAPSSELAHLASMVRNLIPPLTCRWCGKGLDAKHYFWGLGAAFCSPTCRDEALDPSPESEAV